MLRSSSSSQRCVPYLTLPLESCDYPGAVGFRAGQKAWLNSSSIVTGRNDVEAPLATRPTMNTSLSGKALRFFASCINLASGFAKEARKRRLSGFAIESVGRLLELDTVE